jgi:hypothetical protein
MSNKPKTPVKHTLVVLNLPTQIGDKIVKAQFIQKSLTGNVNFPLPYPANIPTLVQIGVDIAALVAAHTLAQSHSTGTSGARNAAMQTVLADLRAILPMIQAVADKTPANSENIIMGAGYDVKKVSPRQKLVDDVLDGDVSGSILLTASGGGAHEWQMSKDQISLINLPATYSANTRVNDLTSGDIWHFRNRPILRNGNIGDWSAWIKLMIR